MLTSTGFAGDQVADPTVHGGTDKAIHHYPFDHYAWWQEQLGNHPLLDKPGAFGENIATMGLTENNSYIGDQFYLGNAVVEISHGRQPCWKLDHHFQRSGKNGVMNHIIRSGKCGIYFRVIETGTVAPDDALVPVEQGDKNWSIARVFSLLIGGNHKKDRAAVAALAKNDKLAATWRSRAEKLAQL